MKKSVAFCSALALTGCLLCGCSVNDGTAYYAQIKADDRKEHGETGVVDLSGNGGLDYSYTLTGINDKGEEKELTFGSSKELIDGRFIELTVQDMRGVTTWKEVTLDEIPENIRSHFE